MPMTTLSSRLFLQDPAGARMAALGGPVFVTEGGRPTHVLLNIEAWRKLVGGAGSIVDTPGEDDECEPGPAVTPIRPADRS